MINENNKGNDEIDFLKTMSSNNTIENNDIDSHIIYYNNEGKKSLYLCFVPIVIFLIGYIHSGGSFSEGDGGAVWWLYFPLLLAVSPITMFVSIYLGIKGLKGNKKILSYISLLINAIEIIFVITVFK
jgi:hypothetical protein